MEEYLTLEQLCSTLGIKKSTAYKLSSKNILPKYKPGGKILLFRASDAVKYIESKRIASKQELKNSVLKQLFKN
jgi:excisionase family DNA binding protein